MESKLVEGDNARFCLTCDELKHFDCFGKDKRGKYGLRSKCKECRSSYAKHKYRRNELLHITNKNIETFRDKLFESKFCSRCDEYKSWNEFSEQTEGKYGYTSICKECIKNHSKEWYSENSEYVLEKQKEYQKNNPEKVKRTKKKWREKNPDFHRNYYQENKKAFRQYQKKFYENNKESVNERKRIRANERYENDVDYRLTKILRTRLYKAVTLEYKTGSAIDFLGCSIKEFKQHLEDQFEEGMTWDNYGRGGWEIDHIIPCASFDFSDEEQQKECFHYTNLQPLWEMDNKFKSDKIL